MAKYYVAMDNEVYGPYTLGELCNLGLMEDTLVCTDAQNATWSQAASYPELQFLFYQEDDSPDYEEEEPVEYDQPVRSSRRERQSFIDSEEMLRYKQKRKAALIGVLTLGLAGLAVVGIGNAWRMNIFRGTSMDNGAVGFILKIVSFLFLSLLFAIPFFIISLVQLIYYHLKIRSLQSR